MRGAVRGDPGGEARYEFFQQGARRVVREFSLGVKEGRGAVDVDFGLLQAGHIEEDEALP